MTISLESSVRRERDFALTTGCDHIRIRLMDKKSDNPERVSATEASRSFSDLLDRVEAGGRFLVHRHGRDVCELASPRVEGRRVSECIAILAGRDPALLDSEFSNDLSEIIAAEPPEDRQSWES